MSAQQTIDQGELQTEDNAAQNEYIVIINKKIRALKKKVQKIGYIETRIAKKEEINEDQKKVLASKDDTLKILKDMENIRNQFLTYYNQKSKDKKPVVPEQKNTGADEVKGILILLHLARLFDINLPGGLEARQAFFAENRKSVVQGNADIDALFPLCSFVFNTPPPSVDEAASVAHKFMTGDASEFVPGVTFKHLKEVYDELVQSRVFLGLPVEHQVVQEPVVTETAAPTQAHIQESQETKNQDSTQQEQADQQHSTETQEEEETAETQEGRGENAEQQQQSQEQFRDAKYRGRGGRGGGGRGRGRGEYRGSGEYRGRGDGRRGRGRGEYRGSGEFRGRGGRGGQQQQQQQQQQQRS